MGRELEEPGDCCVLDVSGDECVVQRADQWHPVLGGGLEKITEYILVMRIFLPRNTESLISL